MADTLESLEIKVQHNATSADTEVSKLASAITALKGALTGLPAALKEVAAGFRGLHESIKGGTAKFDNFAESLTNVAASAELLGEHTKDITELGKAMFSLSFTKISAAGFTSLASGVVKVGEAARTLTPDSLSNLSEMVYILRGLNGIDLQGLGSALNGVRKVGANPMPAPKEKVPLSEELQELISNASGLEVLQAKLESLKIALQEAMDAGDMDKAYSIRQQIINTTEAISKAQAAAERARTEVEETGDAAKKAAAPVAQLSKKIRDVGNAAKSTKKPMSTFISSLKRIAFYRMLRTIIKEIGQAFSEGLNKAYLFSSGLTTEGHRFAEAMDTMKSATTQMKNQLGSAFISLLTILEPILTAIVNLVIKAADAISQFFAAFTGTTYLKAAAVSEKFAEDMDSGAKSAKEWKNQLLGFDVINRLNDNSGGSTGLLDEDAFVGEDAPIDDKWLTIAEKIKGIGEKFKELINSLNFEPVLEGWNNLKESVSGLYDTVKNGLGWAWDNILVPLAHWTIEEAAPALLDLLSAAFGLLKTVLEKLAPILQPLWEDVLKPFFAALGNIILDNLEDLTGLLESITQLINGDISWQEFWDGLSGTQKAILLFVAALGLYKVGSILISAGSAFIRFGKGVADGITKAGQAASSGSKVAKALKLIALGIFDAMMIAYDVQSFASAAKEYRKAQETHTRETETALNTYKRLYDEKGPEIANSWAETVYDIKLSGDDLELNQSLLADHIEGFWADVPQNMWDGFRHGWDYYFVNGEGGGLLGLIGDAFQGVIDWVKQILGIHSPSTVFEEIGIDLVKGLWNGFEDTWGDFTDWLTDAWNAVAEFFGLNHIEIPVEVPNITYQETGEVFGPFFDDSGKVVEEIIPEYIYNIPGVTHKASGGFVDSGELFVARESGPELVGSIGGNTAVANNDQIVEAVSSGVYQAVSSAMGGKNQSVTVHVYLDSREIKSGQQRLARAVGG